MEVKRILIAVNTRWWNAEAHYALNLAQALAGLGHSVWVLGRPGSPVLERATKAGLPLLEGVDLDSNNPLVQLRNWFRLKSFLRGEGIQVIQSFKSNGAFWFSRAKNKLGILHVKTRGEARRPRQNWANRLLYGTWGADGVIAVSELVQGWVQDLDLPGQRHGVIYYGMEPLPERRPGKNPLGIEGGPVLCLLGRAQEVKGHALLLEAFRQLPQEQAHLLFLVKRLDEYPEVIARLQKRIHELELTERVTLTDFVPNLSDVLDSVDLGVVPSLDSEVNCRVTVEFFAKSIPVVAFATGTLPEVIEDGLCGVIVQNKNASALEEALGELLADPAKLRAMGERARERFLEFYQAERMAQETLAFYRECEETR